MPGERHLPRGRRAPLGHPLRPSLGTPHAEPRVVGAHRAGADEHGVTARPHRVDPVEVGRVRQHQALLRRVVEAAVERDRAAEQGVGAVSHGRTAHGIQRAGGGDRADGGTAGHRPCRPAHPAGEEQHRAGKGRDEGDHPERHGRRQALGRPEPGGAEDPGGGTLARTPSGQVEGDGRHHEHDEGERQQGGRRGAHADRAGREHERGQVPGHHHDRRQHHPGGCRSARERPQVAGHDATGPGQPGPARRVPASTARTDHERRPATTERHRQRGRPGQREVEGSRHEQGHRRSG